MKRSRPLRRTTRLRSATTLRRSPLKPRSAKAQAVARKRREMAAEVGPLAVCEFPGCRRSPDDWHERLPRSAGGSPTDPANRVLLCRTDHRLVHDQPKLAYELGLLERRKGQA